MFNWAVLILPQIIKTGHFIKARRQIEIYYSLTSIPPNMEVGVVQLLIKRMVHVCLSEPLLSCPGIALYFLSKFFITDIVKHPLAYISDNFFCSLTISMITPFLMTLILGVYFHYFLFTFTISFPKVLYSINSNKCAFFFSYNSSDTIKIVIVTPIIDMKMFYLHYNNRWIVIVCLLSLHIVFATYRRRDLVPNYFTCPGVSLDEIGTKPQVRLGVMFDEPVNSNISNLRAKLNLTDEDLIPGELLIPHTPLAVIAARQAEIINNDHHILQYHHLCLHYTFVAEKFEDIGRGAVYTYSHNRVRQFVNSILTIDQHVPHSNLMVHYSPLISVYLHWTVDLCPDKISSLVNIFLGEKHEEEKCTGYDDIGFSILPSRHGLFLATYNLITKMGWKKFGIVTTCETFVELWHGDDTVQLTLYNPKDFVTSFQPLQEHEINIIIFVGDLKLYLKMLLEFHNRRKSFVR